MNYNNNKQYNPSALEDLKKIGNSILILKNEIINITSYESFMFSRNKINQKFKLFEDCLNNLINSIIYLDEKNKEKDYLINKYENEIKNIIFNHKEDNNSEKYIKNLNDIRKTINNNNYERINIPNLNELKLNYDYGKLNPNDFLDIPPIYINKNNSRNTNQNNSLISNSNDSKINLDYSKSNTENKLNDNINNNNNNEIITNENINKKNEINNNTIDNKNNTINNNNNTIDNNNNSLNKMDRIQKIVLEIFKDEETLKKFKAKFGDDIAHKITSNSIDEKFLIEVENEVKNLQNKQ